MIGLLKKISQPSRSALVVAAIILHLVLTTSIYVAGRLRLFPAIQQDGIIVPIAPDGIDYICDAQLLGDSLRSGNFHIWFANRSGLHTKLYSISFAVLSPWLGTTTLCGEPVNLVLYLSVLILTFNLGRTIFNQQVGLVAASALAIWPSFLLHTTQLLKDQLFIAAILVLMLIMTRWLIKTTSLSTALLMGGVGGVAVYVVCNTRTGYWIVLLSAVTSIGIALLVLRQIREKQLFSWHMATALLILIGLVVTFSFSVHERFEVVPSPGNPSTAPQSKNAPAEPASSLTPKRRIDLAAVRLWQIRYDYIRAEGTAGTLDSDVVFTRATDLIRYLPRAAMIGLLAPFPDQWFVNGRQTGKIGRIVGSTEMFAAYLLEILVLITLWRSRTNLAVWLLFCVSLLGVTTVALIVMNMGALFRMRYVFFILLLPLAAQGMMQLMQWIKGSQRIQSCEAVFER